MAVDTKFWTGKELEVGVGLDASNVGTIFAGTYTAMEVESVSFPSLGDYKEERRGGAASGKFVSEGDLFVYEPGSTHEISVSGYMTEELQLILMPNVFGQAFAGDPDTIAVAVEASSAGGTNTTFVQNATSANHLTLSFAFNGVGESGFSDCIKLAGCVITSLTLSWDANDDGGRIKFDLTASTRCPSESYTTAATIGAYSTNYCYGTSYNSAWKLMDVECFYKSWALTVENPVSFLGGSDATATSTAGEPQTYVRSVPEMMVTFASVVKYDTGLDGLWAISRLSGTSATNGSTNAVFIDSSDDSKQIHIEKASIEEIAWDEGDFLGLATTIKARNSGGTNVVKYVWG